MIYMAAESTVTLVCRSKQRSFYSETKKIYIYIYQNSQTKPKKPSVNAGPSRLVESSPGTLSK